MRNQYTGMQLIYEQHILDKEQLDDPNTYAKMALELAECDSAEQFKELTKSIHNTLFKSANKYVSTSKNKSFFWNKLTRATKELEETITGSGPAIVAGHPATSSFLNTVLYYANWLNEREHKFNPEDLLKDAIYKKTKDFFIVNWEEWHKIYADTKKAREIQKRATDATKGKWNFGGAVV